MNAIKRLLEALRIVRLVWFTHPWDKCADEIVLRVVRYQGPRKQPWVQSANGWRAILLSNGKCQGKFICSWEPYNQRSPRPDIPKPAATKDAHFEKDPPAPSAWAN